jgi:lysophospholipase L1-like esterase
MKLNHIRKFFAPAALTVFVAACTPAIDAPIPTRGKADFSNFVALGNSLTAGYGDGALYLDGQINSFPNILATQFKAAGGGEFVQPLLPAGPGFGGGTPGNFTGRFMAYETKDANFKPFYLMTSARDVPQPLNPENRPPVRADIDPTKSNWRITDANVINNLGNFGVPGARLWHSVVPGYARLNPFFARFAKNIGAAVGDPTASSMVGDAAARKPTFFIIGLGNNDVLGYATSGGVPQAGDTIPQGVFGPTRIPASITPPAIFQTVYDNALNAMLAANPNSKGVVITVPDVTRVPFFNTVGPSLATRAKDPVARLFYISSAGTPAVLETANPATGLLTLTARTALAQGLATGNPFGTPTNPLPSQFVLDPAEIANCRNALNAYNAHIRSKQSDRVAVLDIAPFIDGLVRGTVVNGTTVNSGFIAGGAFALDGVHLTPRGYAMVANEIIKTINSTFGSTILQVNPLNYDGIIVRQ